MKSLKKTILASALAVTLVGGMFAPKASAAPVQPQDPKIWKDLKITKILQKVEKGVTTPDVNFEFKFEPISNGAPEINNVTIPFKAADNTDADDVEPGIQVENIGSVDLSKIEWPEAGIYDYRLYEVIPETGIKDMDYGYYLYDGKYKKQRQDRNICYNVNVKVEKKGTNLEVTGITVKSFLDGKRYKKLDYDAVKGIKFKNYYDKKDGNTPQPGGGTEITEADKKGFAFKKIVDSKYDTDKEKEFEFNLQVINQLNHIQKTQNLNMLL